MSAPPDWAAVKALFHAALELDPAERIAFVERESDDVRVVQEVTSLLEANSAANGFLSQPGAIGEAPAAVTRLQAGDRLGRYAVVSLIGAGGMGEVYRAHDDHIGRDVALKVLPAHKGNDADAVERLAREARAIGALSHPAILTIHDIGSDGGRLFLVTELLEGETLRPRVTRGPTPWRDAIAIAVPVAGAMAAAHASGVVHRDLKPENVFVTTSGAVKVLDFGVARHIGSGDTHTPTGTALTTPGMAVGTLAYMAPEQLEGRSLDHRADQFAFGILMHELLTGRHPFSGATPHEIAAAILRDAPRGLPAQVADLPPRLAEIVTRCLAKRADERFASTNDLVRDLQALLTAVAVPTAAPVAASAPETRPTPPVSRRWLVWTAGGAFAAALGAWAWTRPIATPARPPTAAVVTESLVAVLPFTTLGDSEGYVADGVTEAVTRELGRVGRLRVIAPNTAFAYRQRPDAIHQELGVGLLVQGSVQRAGGTIRVNTSLVDAAKATTLWSERYDRTAANVLAIQDDIAWQVAAHLATTVGSPVPERPAGSGGTSAEAYDAYLQGLAHMRGRTSLPNTGARLSAAISGFSRAAALDPNFALAHAMLASANTQRFFYDATDAALEQRAFVEIEKALALNPDQAEAFLARAQLVWNMRTGFQHERAVADLKRAIAINPSLAEAHVELGKVYYHIGLLDKAVAENDEALRLDPLATVAARRRLGALYDASRFAEVREELGRNPRWLAPSLRAEALLALDDAPEALAVLTAPTPGQPQRDTGFRDLEPNTVSALAHAYAKLGRRAEAEKTLAAAIPLVVNPTGLSDIHHAQFSMGCAYALLGDKDEAVRWLTKAAEEGLPSYPKFLGHVDTGLLKGHPGFDALLERLRRDWERWNATL